MLFLLTDGDDNRVYGKSYEALGRDAADAGVTIYAFVLGDATGAAKRQAIERMAEATGGRMFEGRDDALASVGEGLTGWTDGLRRDANKDGIPDYYNDLSFPWTIVGGGIPPEMLCARPFVALSL